MPTLPRPFVIKRPCALSQHLAPFSFSVTWWEITMGGSGVHFLWLRGPSDPGVLWSGHLSSLSVFCLSRQPALWGAPFYSLDFLDLGASRQQTNFPKPDSVIFLDRRGSQEVGLFGTSKTQQTHSQRRSVIPQLLWQPNWVETEGNPGFWWGKWSTYLDMQGWEQLFSPGGSFVLQGCLAIYGDFFVGLAVVGWYYWHLVAGGQGCCYTSCNAQGSPSQQGIIQAQTSLVPRLQGRGQEHELPWVTLSSFMLTGTPKLPCPCLDT